MLNNIEQLQLDLIAYPLRSSFQKFGKFFHTYLSFFFNLNYGDDYFQTYQISFLD